MLAAKMSHSIGAVEVVAHEEAAPQQVLAHRPRLLVGQVPVTDFDSVKPRPVPYVAFVEVHRLLHTARVDAAQTAHGRGQVPVAARIVHGPVGPALLPRAVEFETSPNAAHRRIHQARKRPLALLLIVPGQGEFGVFHTGKLAERTLESVEGGKYRQRSGNEDSGAAEVGWKQHWCSLQNTTRSMW